MLDFFKKIVQEISDDGASKVEVDALREQAEKLKKSSLNNKNVKEINRRIEVTRSVGGKQTRSFTDALEAVVRKVGSENARAGEDDQALLVSIAEELENKGKDARLERANSEGRELIIGNTIDAIREGLGEMAKRIDALKTSSGTTVSGLKKQVIEMHSHLVKQLEEVRGMLEFRVNENRIQKEANDKTQKGINPLEALLAAAKRRMDNAQSERIRLSKKLRDLQAQKERLEKQLAAGEAHNVRLNLRFPESQKGNPTGFFKQFMDLAYITYSKLKSMPEYSMVLGATIGVGGVIGYFFL